MIAECTMKLHGQWYHAGDELPSPADFSTELVERNVTTAHAEPEKPAYTKTEINRMSTKELKDLAEKNGISSGADMTGAELKRYFISLWGL